jgi:hypothetical protein
MSVKRTAFIDRWKRSDWRTDVDECYIRRMDIAARREDPAVEEMARSIYALFPRCMRCGEPIARYEDADVRILSHRVVHRGACAEAEGPEPTDQSSAS